MITTHFELCQFPYNKEENSSGHVLRCGRAIRRIVFVTQTITPRKKQKAIAPNLPTHPRMIDAVEKRGQIVHLRKQGYSMQACADATGLALRAAYDAFHTAMDERRANAEEVAELRQLENDRLDALTVALWGKAMRGDLEAINTALRISARRAKLWGLDAPTRIDGVLDINESGKVPLAELDRIVREYESRSAATARVVNP